MGRWKQLLRETSTAGKDKPYSFRLFILCQIYFYVQILLNAVGGF